MEKEDTGILALGAGHACQNLYLSAGSVDCGVCAIAAFSDDDMNDLLLLDGEERFVMYVATVGKNKAARRQKYILTSTIKI